MAQLPTQSVTPHDLIRVAGDYRRWWLTPLIAGAVLTAVYSLIAPPPWEAAQAMIVRGEASGSSQSRPGKFTDMSEMKTLQETILEVVRTRDVLASVLRQVGPRGGRAARASWPTAQDVADLRDNVRMTPPHGAEFGMTEVFYFAVRDRDRQRAERLVTALTNELEQRFQALRQQRAGSMIHELENAVSIANEDLEQATKKLADLEAQVGADLGELRQLQSSNSSSSDMHQRILAMENERRQFQAQQLKNVKLKTILQSAQRDPNELLATPNSLLTSEPALRRLKDGLVDAQLATARLSGTRLPAHPLVIAAKEAENSIRADLHRELGVAVRGLEIEQQLTADRVGALDGLLEATRHRLGELAGLRAEYANLVAAAENSAQRLEAARKSLTAARASQAGADGASVIGRIGGPDTGVRRVGLSRKATVAAGAMAGFILGLGGVFLIAIPTEPASVGIRSTANDREHATAKGLHWWEQPIATPTANERSHTRSAAAETAEVAPFGVPSSLTLREAIERARHKVRRS